jgi:hypothetical protein
LAKPRSAYEAHREAQIRREGHGGWLGENKGLLGERESRERKQKDSRGGEHTREIFWKMVYEIFFHKSFF